MKISPRAKTPNPKGDLQLRFNGQRHGPWSSARRLLSQSRHWLPVRMSLLRSIKREVKPGLVSVWLGSSASPKILVPTTLRSHRNAKPLQRYFHRPFSIYTCSWPIPLAAYVVGSHELYLGKCQLELAPTVASSLELDTASDATANRWKALKQGLSNGARIMKFP